VCNGAGAAQDWRTVQAQLAKDFLASSTFRIADVVTPIQLSLVLDSSGLRPLSVGAATNTVTGASFAIALQLGCQSAITNFTATDGNPCLVLESLPRRSALEATAPYAALGTCDLEGDYGGQHRRFIHPLRGGA